MASSPGSLHSRGCLTGTMRLASAAQQPSPGLSPETNASVGGGPPADVSCLADSFTRSDGIVSHHGGRSQKHSTQTACRQEEAEEEPEEDDDDDDDELLTLSLDEAIAAVFEQAAGRSLPQQAREALVPPSSSSSPAKIAAAAGAEASSSGGGAAGPGQLPKCEGRQRRKQQDTVGASGAFPEGDGPLTRQQTARSSQSRASGTSGDSGYSYDGDQGSHSSSADAQRYPSAGGNTGDSNSGSSAARRRLLWLRLLGVLQDTNPLKWAEQLQQQRAAYAKLQEEEELQLSAKRLTSLDPQRFHPLAATADNPWSQRQQNEALLSEIWKDVERTLAERRLFRSEATRKALQRILFTWSRRNPEVSYKQGMNELLAIFYLVCYREKLHVPASQRGASNSRSNKPSTAWRGASKTTSGKDGSNAPEEKADPPPPQQQQPQRGWGEEREVTVQILLSPDPAAVEADAFALFDSVMNRFMLKAAYLPAPAAAFSAGGGATSLLHKGSSSGSGSGRFLGCAAGIGGGLPPLVTRTALAGVSSKSALLWRCSYIFETLLPFVDRPLYEHLKSEEVEPQLFLLRWLRLLFSREFHVEDTLLLWDALFADAYLHEAIERGGHTPAYAAAAATAARSSAATAAAACRTGADNGLHQDTLPQHQQQQTVKEAGSNSYFDPFRSLLRYPTAAATGKGGTAAAEVMYDPEQLATAAAAKLPLVDYFVLAMLKYVRATLLESNQILCLRRLLRFPPTESIQPLVLLAVSLRTRKIPYVGGRVSAPGVVTPQCPLALCPPIDRQTPLPPFPSMVCTQPQPQQRQELQHVQQHAQQPHQQVQEHLQQQQQWLQQKQQQQQQEEPVSRPGFRAPVGVSQEATATAAEQQQQHSSLSEEKLPHVADRTAETSLGSISATAPAPLTAAAGAVAAQECKANSPFGVKREIYASCCTQKREDLPSLSGRSPATELSLGAPAAAADAAAGGGAAGQPPVAAAATCAAADGSRRAGIATASGSSSSNDSSAGGRDQRRSSPPAVHIDIRPSAAKGCSESTAAAAVGSTGSSSSSSWLQERQQHSETETGAGDGASHIIAGRTISKHVEEIAADIRAALALWSSKELLAYQNSSRDVVTVGAAAAAAAEEEGKARRQTFYSYAQRLQAAEECTAAALVRLQLLHRVLEGDIPYSPSLFPPPAAGSSSCCAAGAGGAARAAGAAAAAAEEEPTAAAAAAAAQGSSSSSRSEEASESAAGARAAAVPATVWREGIREDVRFC